MAKKLFLLLVITILIFNSKATEIDTTYKSYWLEIDTLITVNNLPKTALEKIESLYKKAKSSSNETQTLKCLIYKLALQDVIFENKPNNAIAILKEEILETKCDGNKRILYSLLANRYQQYYFENRWRIYQRSKTLHYRNEDIETWSVNDFGEAITANYKKSITNIVPLQTISINDYASIVTNGNEENKYSTLYDLLMHEALNYFKTGDYYLSKPSYSFKLQDSSAIMPSNIFTNTAFNHEDTASHLLISLKLFQELEKFHSNDSNKSELINITLERINWVNSSLVCSNKDELYKNTLKNICELNEDNAAKACYLLANLDRIDANTFIPLLDTTHRYSNLKALNFIEKTMPRFNEASYGIKQLKKLKHDITAKSLATTTESVNIPNQPFRALVEFSNVQKIYIRIIKETNYIQLPEYNFSGRDEYWEKWRSLKPFKSFEQTLPLTIDYQKHSVEIKIDALPVGKYHMLCSTGENFNDRTDKLCKQSFTISNIAYFKNGNSFFVANRETGQPLKNVKVTITRDTWNNSLSKNVINEAYVLKTNRNGQFNFSPKNGNDNYSFVFENKNDTLKLDRYEYLNSMTSSDEEDENMDEDDKEEFEEDNTRVFFFTDRSIYRPGQRIYFKGIVLTKDYKTKQSKLLVGKDSLQVFLEDTNSEKIDTAYFKTNEYGSFSGSFIIPENVLLGEFRLNADDYEQSITRFKVEEYKRPKFYLTFDKAKTTYSINDSVTITGTAKAFAGNIINGAEVIYTISRKTRLANDWLWSNTHRYRYDNKQITYGKTKTDENGIFRITFKAIGDDLIDKETNPLFDFFVNAEITDLNGETKTSSTKLTVGYKNIILKVSAPKIKEASSFNSIYITTKNLNDEIEPALINIAIYRLQTPDRLIKKSIWRRADLFVMDRKDYISNFPNDDYNDDLNESKWPIKQQLYQSSFNNKDSSVFLIPSFLQKPGYYKIVATIFDKEGSEIKDIKYVQLFSNSEAPYPQYNFSYTKNNYVPVNQTASFFSGASAQNVFLVRHTQSKTIQKRMGKSFDDLSKIEVLNFQNGIHQTTYTSLKSDKGNVAISEAYILHNRFYTNYFHIEIPQENKQLQLSYTSFRNKTEPGSNETYTVTMSNSNREKMAAELLTTMYDASLDEFTKHSFSIPNIWSRVYLQNNFSKGMGFDVEYSNSNNEVEYEKIPTINRVELLKSKSQVINSALNNTLNYKREKLKTSKSGNADSISVISYHINIEETHQLQGKVSGVQIIDSNKSLNEVIVSGYGVKKNMTASISTISSTTINRENAILQIRALTSITNENIILVVVDGVITKKTFKDLDLLDVSSIDVVKPEQANAMYGLIGINGALIVTSKDVTKKKVEEPFIKVRKNNNETAFFFPNLYADSASNFSFSFTMPEALTQWKWLSFAHTKNLAFGSNSTIIETQKTLMVQPNVPRFLRAGDTIDFVTKIANLSDIKLSGNCNLELLDAISGELINEAFNNNLPLQNFVVNANQSTVLKFPIVIPINYAKPLTWRLVAKAGLIGDGEENTIPILTNRLLITESVPLYLKPNEQEKEIKFNKLINSTSKTLTHNSLTIEYTSNPIWSVVKSLPYLIEYPYECGEQTFNRLLANAMASFIINKNPKIKYVLENWKNNPSLSKSNLEKNEELKQVLIQETPWVLSVEKEQKKNVAILFERINSKNYTYTLVDKLSELQLPNGGFAWFKGGGVDRYITNYIVTGIGKIKNLGDELLNSKLKKISEKALKFLDEQLTTDYNELVTKKVNLNFQHINSFQIQILYTKSFFVNDIKNTEAFNFYYNQAKQYWSKQNNFHAAMIGLILSRSNDTLLLHNNILPSILENAIEDTSTGTLFWKDRTTLFWYNSPIEHQTMLINFLNEVALKYNDSKLSKQVDAAKTWLLLNKQTNNWKTTVATAEACFSLLNSVNNWTSNDNLVQVQLGDSMLNLSSIKNFDKNNNYFKEQIIGNEIKKEMGNIVLKSNFYNKNVSTPSYGGVYWQYFEDLDKITPTLSPLSIDKKLFVERNLNNEKFIEQIKENDELNVGDKIIVRIEILIHKTMEYLHLKDMRASCTEPLNILSGYKWQDGVSYYEVTKDANTNFFIDKLEKGTYVFEYPLIITHSGTFSVGIANIQCMYAPEFTSHTKGIVIKVKKLTSSK